MRIVRALISDGGYGEYFIHRAGQGIGVTAHEPPYRVEGASTNSSRGSHELAVVS